MKRKLRIENVITILECNRLNILTVSDWALKMRYSRSHFSRCFKKEFGVSPKDYLKEFRLRLIKEEIRKDPEAIGYKIAVNCGFLDEKALHKYLAFNYSTTLSGVKSQVS